MNNNVDNNVDIIRLFSRQTYSATIIVDKNNGIQIVGGTPVHSPNHTPAPSPPGSRSRANSYDLECYKALAKEYESAGNIYNFN